MYLTYDELKEKALSPDATAKDRVALFRRLEQDDMRSWNGECFYLGDGLCLYPVYDITYDEDGEIEEIELLDAEIRP